MLAVRRLVVVETSVVFVAESCVCSWLVSLSLFARRRRLKQHYHIVFLCVLWMTESCWFVGLSFARYEEVSSNQNRDRNIMDVE